MSKTISKLAAAIESADIEAVIAAAQTFLTEAGEPTERYTDKLDRNPSNDRFMMAGIEDALGRDDVELLRKRARYFLDHLGLGEKLVKTEIDRGTGDFEVKSYFADGGQHSFYFETSRLARAEARRWLESTVKTEVIHRPTNTIIGEYRPLINI